MQCKNLIFVLMIVIIQETMELNPDIRKYAEWVNDAEETVKKIKADEKQSEQYGTNKHTYILHGKREVNSRTQIAQDLMEMTPEKFAGLSADEQQRYFEKIQETIEEKYVLKETVKEKYVPKETVDEKFVPKKDYDSLKSDFELLMSPELADLDQEPRHNITNEIWYRRKNFDNMPYHQYQPREANKCDIYWADIPTTNRSGACFKGPHMLAIFMFFEGKRGPGGAVQVCGFPLSSKEDTFEQSSLLNTYYPKDPYDPTFQVRPDFDINRKTFLYRQPVCVDARVLQRRYGRVGRLAPTLCRKVKKLEMDMEDLRYYC